MKNAFTMLLAAGLALTFASCQKDNLGALDVQKDNLTSKNNPLNLELRKAGATQIGGIGYYADVAECDYVAEGAAFALRLEGDLEGCLFVYVDSYGCSPSGTYREAGREHFVGTYKGEAGTFWTNYKFEAKFEGCSEEGFFLGAEIFGRCQHPLEKGSGTGVFDGATGRIDFKDDIDAGNFPYRGHFRY